MESWMDHGHGSNRPNVGLDNYNHNYYLLHHFGIYWFEGRQKWNIVKVSDKIHSLSNMFELELKTINKDK